MAGARSLPSPMNMAMVVVLRREGGEVNKAAAAGARVCWTRRGGGWRQGRGRRSRGRELLCFFLLKNCVRGGVCVEPPDPARACFSSVLYSYMRNMRIGATMSNFLCSWFVGLIGGLNCTLSMRFWVAGAYQLVFFLFCLSSFVLAECTIRVEKLDDISS